MSESSGIPSRPSGDATAQRPPVLSPREFRARLKRERSRCDRSGTAFSVVLFRPPRGSRGTRIPSPFDGIGRLRLSDELGRLRRGVFAILLTDTDREGATGFVAALLAQHEPLHRTHRISVRTYPHLPDLHSGDPRSSYAYADMDLASALAPRVPRWKRTLDIVGALLGLLLFSPLFLIYPIYLAVVSPGPLLYRQERIGFRGRRFTFLKFRSMHVNNSAGSHAGHLKALIRGDAPMEKLDDGRDPRIIPGGRLLRNSSLDEVPQFINVLRGEMSLVGPRPCIPYEAEEYLRWHAHRFDVLPGMSGLWQVSGKNRLSFKEMIRLDIAYTRRMSPWLDLWIIIATFPSIAVEAALKLRARLNHPTHEVDKSHEQSEAI